MIYVGVLPQNQTNTESKVKFTDGDALDCNISCHPGQYLRRCNSLPNGIASRLGHAGVHNFLRLFRRLRVCHPCGDVTFMDLTLFNVFFPL